MLSRPNSQKDRKVLRILIPRAPRSRHLTIVALQLYQHDLETKITIIVISTIIIICSVAVVSSVVVMSSHIITNRMRFYFFQSKCVVIVSSACHFPTRGGMQSKSVKRSLRFPRSKFENFLTPFGTLRIGERVRFW